MGETIFSETVFSVLSGKPTPTPTAITWGPYVCRKQTISGIDYNGNPIGGVYYTCITDCDSNPADCNSPNYPHHCNQSGDCGEPTLPEQCDGYNLDSTTTYVSECYNVNSCSECS